MVYSNVYSSLQNISNQIILVGNPIDPILVQRFFRLSSQFKIILASISERAFKFEKTGFFSDLTYDINQLIQKVIFYDLPWLFKNAQILDKRLDVISVKIKLESSSGPFQIKRSFKFFQ